MYIGDVMTNEEKIKLANAIKVVKEHKEKLRKKEQKFRECVGVGYDDFISSKNRYRVLKGGRASKKSTTAALEAIHRIEVNPKANMVVVRKVANTNKDSTWAQLKWAARQLGTYDDWEFKVSPLEAIYKPTGQKILFRGFDDPLKLTSITVDVGELCWAWIEEAYEIDSESDFDTFDESIRGEMPEGLFKQITLTFNPWINTHWTKERFFDKKDHNAFTLTTTHKCNEFLDEADHEKIEALAITNPNRYKVVGLGDYGIPGGTFFSEWRSDVHVIEPFIIPKHWDRYTVTDYGLDMQATLWIAIDEQGKGYAYKESYKPNLIISEAAIEILRINNKEVLRCQYAPPDLWNRRQETGKSAKDIFAENGVNFIKSDNNRENGCMAAKEWLKPYDVNDEYTGKKIKRSDFVFFKNCANAIRCIPQIQTDEKNPNVYATEPHELTHIVDAFRYFAIMRTAPSKGLKDRLPSYYLPSALKSKEPPKQNSLAGNVQGGFTW